MNSPVRAMDRKTCIVIKVKRTVQRGNNALWLDSVPIRKHGRGSECTGIEALHHNLALFGVEWKVRMKKWQTELFNIGRTCTQIIFARVTHLILKWVKKETRSSSQSL